MALFALTAARSIHAQEEKAPEAPPAPPLETVPVTELSPEKEPESAKSEEASSTRLEDIVVTSTKRVRALRDIPATITVLQGEKLEAAGAQGMEDYLKLVPGVSFGPQDIGYNAVSVRGISGDPYTSQTTGVLFGDLSFNDFFKPKVTLDPNPFDLRTVEVLKGPQGTLFGAASLNGALRFVPEPPNLTESQLKYFVQYQGISEGEIQPVFGAAANLPLGGEGTAGVRVMGFSRRAPGYLDNTGMGLKDVNSLRQDGGRAILAWEPEDWRIAAMYARQDTDSRSIATTDNQEGRVSTGNQPRLSPSHTYYDLADLNIRRSFSWFDVVSDTGHVKTKADSFYDLSRFTNGDQPGVAVTVIHESDTWSQELRLASPEGDSGRWQWVGGIFGVRQKIFDVLGAPVGDPLLPAQFQSLLNLVPGLGGFFAPDGRVTLATNTLDVTVTEIALFGELTRRLGEHWEVTLGGRYYDNHLYGTATTVQGTSTTVKEGDLRERGINPKLSVRWKPSRDWLAFLSASRGYRIGGFQPTPMSVGPKQPPSEFKSDEIWNFESGLRTQWLDRTLRLDLTVFYEIWKNPQLAQVDASAINQWVDNVGGATSEGVELAALYRLPIDGLTLSANANYLKTVTTEAFLTATNTPVEAGSPWAYAPRWQTATTLAYALPVGSWLAGASVTHTYASSAWTTLDRYGQVFGDQLWDAQVSLANRSIAWIPAVTLTMTNLANTRMKTMNRPPASTSPAPYDDVIYTTPRSWILRLSGQF